MPVTVTQSSYSASERERGVRSVGVIMEHAFLFLLLNSCTSSSIEIAFEASAGAAALRDGYGGSAVTRGGKSRKTPCGGNVRRWGWHWTSRSLEL